MAEQPLRAEIAGGQSLVAGSKDARSALRTEQAVTHTEGIFQLQVGPVPERIAQRVRHRAGPRFELLPSARLAGDEPLGHAVGPHGAPLVVVAVEPELADAGEAMVLGDQP